MTLNCTEYDCIFIHGLELRMSIGIHDHEKAAHQRVIIDLEAEHLKRPQGSPDEIRTALSYETIVRRIQGIAASRHFNLAETLAEEITTAVLDDPRIERITLRITKPDIMPETQGVGVKIVRSR